MTETNARTVYLDLLDRENQLLLEDIGLDLVVDCTAIAYQAGIIECPSTEIQDRGDFNRACSRFSIKLKVASPPRDNMRSWPSGEVPFASLGFYFDKNKKYLDTIPRGYNSLYRRRCQLLPVLFRVLREHRNMREHEGEGIGTVAQIATLSGTILSILELSRLGEDDRIGNLRDQCEKALTVVADRIREDDDDIATVEELQRCLELENRKNSDLEKELRSLKQTRKTTGIDSVLSAMESVEEGLIRKFQEVTDSLSVKIMKRSDSLDFDVKKIIIPSLEILQGVPSDGYEDTVIENEYEIPDPNEDRITSHMARERLRNLRDTIRKEENVDAWENICMMNPIVTETISVARKREIKTIDEWKNIPKVRSRYDKHRETMDAQIKKYGEDMIAIYRLIERGSEGDDSN